MTEVPWNLKIDPKIWNKLDEDDKEEVLNDIAESIQGFGDLQGMVEIDGM